MHRGDEAASAYDAGFSAQDFGEALAQAASGMDAMAAEREGVAHLSKEQISDLDAAQGEKRDQLVAAIGSQPNLKAQAEASGGVQQYAGALLETWRRWALQMSRRTGENPADIYRRISFSGGQQIDQSNPAKGTTVVQGVTSGTRLSGERPAQGKGLTNPGSISSMDRNMGSVLWQESDSERFERDDIERKPDSAIASVVEDNGVGIPEFKKQKELAEWLFNHFGITGDVEIKSTGKTVRITKTGVRASFKRNRELGHQTSYTMLDRLIASSEYDHSETADGQKKHSGVGGQDVYHAAYRLNGKLYAVRLKFDIPAGSEVEVRKKSTRKRK